MKNILLLTIAFVFIDITSFSQRPSSNKILYAASFDKPLSEKEWIIEMEPRENSNVFTQDRKLVLDTKGGVTVWLAKSLSGNIQIEFTRCVKMEGKVNDRLSDLNQFWMAKDPRRENLFTRKGDFAAYDSLQLYYVGMGGNENATTRLRKYDGKGNREVVKEFLDADHLLKPNKNYRVKIIVKDGVTSFWVDDECYFSFNDPSPLKEGYFGFRSLRSRQEISHFVIYQLP